MMWKEMIDASEMDIDLLSEKFHITGTTLDMPSWTSWYSNAFPIDYECRFPSIWTIRLCIVSFPESEVSHLFFFVFIIIDPYARLHAFHINMGKLSIVLEFRDRIVNTPIVCQIGIALIEQTLYHHLHLIDECRNRRDHISASDVQAFDIFEKYFRVELSK